LLSHLLQFLVHQNDKKKSRLWRDQRADDVA